MADPAFNKDIRPLFRDKDRDSMAARFDLRSYQDVRTNATAILEALQAGRHLECSRGERKCQSSRVYRRVRTRGGRNPSAVVIRQARLMPAGGGDLNNVFTFATDPSQPSGDLDLYLRIAPGTDYTGCDACFATFVPRADAAALAAVQRPLALGAFTAVSGSPAWASIPSWAVIGTQDQAIPSAELTFMAKRARSKVTYVTAGHLSMVTQPRVVADVISKAAGATR